MLEAVPYCAIRRRPAQTDRGGFFTYILFSQHLGCSANLILGGDNERNHRGSISTSGFKTLDQLLDLPDLDILLSFVRRRGAHLGEATVDQGGKVIGGPADA